MSDQPRCSNCHKQLPFRNGLCRRCGTIEISKDQPDDLVAITGMNCEDLIGEIYHVKRSDFNKAFGKTNLPPEKSQIYTQEKVEELAERFDIDLNKISDNQDEINVITGKRITGD